MNTPNHLRHDFRFTSRDGLDLLLWLSAILRDEEAELRQADLGYLLAWAELKRTVGRPLGLATQ